MTLEISGDRVPAPDPQIEERLREALDRGGVPHKIRRAPDGRLLLELKTSSPVAHRYVKGLLEAWGQRVGVVLP
jgi:hypothetical protein